MKKTSCVIVSNCQGRPLGSILTTLYEIECQDIIIVHLAKDSDAERFDACLNSADVVISQHIQDQYPCSFVRTSSLQQRLGDRLITIPNIFYRGYTPDLRYLRLRARGTLNGPLGDYHSSILLNAWKEGEDQDIALERYNNVDLWREQYSTIAEQSLAELQRRELELDIQISDCIATMQSQQQLFYSFNHPSKAMIKILADRIAEHLDLTPKPEGNASVEAMREPLDRIQIPLHPFTRQHLGLNFPGPDRFQGEAMKPGKRQPVHFQLPKLTKRFFKHYNNRRDEILEYGVW